MKEVRLTVKKEKEEFTRIYKRVCMPDGSVVYYTRVDVMQAITSSVKIFDAVDVAVALKLPKTGTVVDLRHAPPFLTMSPCPYCGTLNDRGHNPMKHIDHTLGEVVA